MLLPLDLLAITLDNWGLMVLEKSPHSQIVQSLLNNKGKYFITGHRHLDGNVYSICVCCFGRVYICQLHVENKRQNKCTETKQIRVQLQSQQMYGTQKERESVD